jgi:hypothetical protein
METAPLYYPRDCVCAESYLRRKLTGVTENSQISLTGLQMLYH